MSKKTVVALQSAKQVSSICKIWNISIDTFIDANNVKFKKYNNDAWLEYEKFKKKQDKYEEAKKAGTATKKDKKEIEKLYGALSSVAKLFADTSYTNESKVSDYLREQQKKNKKVVKGLKLVKPTVKTVSSSNSSTAVATSNTNTSSKPPEAVYSTKYLLETDNEYSKVSGGLRSEYTDGLGLITTKRATYSSYFIRVKPNAKDEKDKKPMYLPVIPTEFSETNSANWNPISLMGRSVDYQIYTGSSRTVSFTLQLHQELYVDIEGYAGIDNIYNLVASIESCNYPYYNIKDSAGWAGPPEVVFKIGQQFYIRGVLESCSATWKAPFDEQGRYKNCDLSISVKETTGPWGVGNIYRKDGGLKSYRLPGKESTK